MWVGMLFVCVAGLSFVALAWANLRRARSGGRLVDDEGEGDLRSMLGGMAPALAKQIPASEEHLAELEPELRSAGFYGKNALTQFLAIRATLIIVPLLIAVAAAALLDKSRIPQIIVVGIILAVLGFAVPRIYVHYVGRTRRRRLEQGLPTAVDLLALGITA